MNIATTETAAGGKIVAEEISRAMWKTGSMDGLLYESRRDRNSNQAVPRNLASPTSARCSLSPAHLDLLLGPSVPARPRPVFCCSSSMRLDASAFVRLSSKDSWASSESVFKYERCAPVIGSSPVTHSSGSFAMLLFSASCCVRLSVMIGNSPSQKIASRA